MRQSRRALGMMVQSHLLATLLLGLVAGLRSRRDWALAVGFGVAMDLDHLLQVPAYVATHRAAALDVGAAVRWGHEWQGFMHTPWALALVLPATLLWRSWIPLAFWALHLVLDFVVATRLVVFGSWQEYAVDAALVGALAAVVALRHRRDGRPLSFARYALATFGLAR
jgi:hypothetical protein